MEQGIHLALYPRPISHPSMATYCSSNMPGPGEQKRDNASASAQLTAWWGQTRGRSCTIENDTLCPVLGKDTGDMPHSSSLALWEGSHVGWGQTPNCPLPPPAPLCFTPPRPVQSACPLWLLLMKGISTHPETGLLPAGI